MICSRSPSASPKSQLALGSSDDKEKIGVARPEGPPLRSKGQRIEETVKKSSQNKQDRDILLSPVKPMMSKLYSPVQ